jgi:flagellar basal body-associated protein FliL
VCCGYNVYPINITNTAEDSNWISIWSEDVSLSNKNFYLPSGESQTVYAVTNTSCKDSISETYTIYAAVDGKPSSQKEVSFRLESVSAYECNKIVFGYNQNRIFYENSSARITLENKGIKDSGYLMILDSPDWMHLNDEFFTIKSGDTNSTYILLEPTNNTPLGMHNFTLTAIAENGYRHTFTSSFNLVEKTWMDKAKEYAEDHSLLLIIGFLIFIIIIILLILLIRWTSRNNDKKNAAREKELAKKSVKAHIEREVKREVKRQIKSESKRSESKGRSGWSWIPLILLLILLLCLVILAIFNPEVFSINGKNETSSNMTGNDTVVINDTKENLTEEDNEYGIVILNDDITMDSISLKENIYRLSLSSDGEKETVIYTSGKGCPYRVLVSGDETDFKCTGSTIVIPMNFSRKTVKLDYNFPEVINDTSIPKNDSNTTFPNSTITESSKGLFEKIALWFQRPISEKSNMTEEKEEKITGPSEEEILYNSLVEENLTESFQFLVLEVNEVGRVDLSKHFIDPDKEDYLTYSSSQPNQIFVKIEGNVATLTPKEDWHGIDYITFYATDSQGDKAVSPEVTVIVRDVEDRPIAGLWNKIITSSRSYMVYVLFGLLILIVLILLIAITSNNKNQKKKK